MNMTIEYILSLRVVDLKQELKDRGCPVTGVKAVLQKRLADAVGVSLESSEKDSTNNVRSNTTSKQASSKHQRHNNTNKILRQAAQVWRQSKYSDK